MNFACPVWILLLAGVFRLAASDPASFRVATYNVENYLLEATETRKAKPEDSKAKVVELLLAANPDVVALQEIGPRPALLDLQSRLKAGGLDLPHLEHAAGFDTNIFVAVLSRFPLTQRRSHTNENFLLNGRRFRVSRAFGEVEVQVTPRYRFTLITAHLKSRRQSLAADESDLREREAARLREKIDARLKSNPQENLLVAGDLNDVKDSPPIKSVLGRGRSALIDTRPAERNGDDSAPSAEGSVKRDVVWTHFYWKEDTYSRVDYLLLSSGMAREWDKSQTWIQTSPGWGIASDHRPLLATFSTLDR